MPVNNVDEIIHKHAEGLSKVILPGGIVGKTSYVLMAVCAALATIVVAVRTAAIGYAAIGALLAIVVPTIFRLIRFAEKHPETAILEGAEYVAYQRIQLAQKGIGALPPSPAVPATVEPIDILLAEIEAPKLPDTPPPETQPPKRLKKNG